MTCTINASTSSSAIVSSADGSGVLKVQSNGVTTNALAWVRFNGVTTVTIASSYNVSSVTRATTGDYTVNFANALTDANYSMVGSASAGVETATTNNGIFVAPFGATAPTTSAARVVMKQNGNPTIAADAAYCNVAIFGN